MRRISEKLGIDVDFWLAGLGLLGIALLLILQPLEGDPAHDQIQNLALVLAGVLLPTLWMAGKDSKWQERLGMVVVLLVPTGVAVWLKHFTVTTILIVGNSHGGLQDDIDRFNIAFAADNLRAELVVDWQSYSDTNQRFEIAQDFLSGKRQAHVIELDTVWLPGAIEDEGLLPLTGFFIPSSPWWKYIF